MSQDWMQQGPPPPPPPPPAYNPYGYGGAPPPPPGGGTFPWEDRARLGFVTAFIETAKLLVTQPREAFARLQPNGDLTSPLLFGLIASWPAVLVSLMFQVLMGGLMGSFGNAEAAGFGILQIGLVAVLYPLGYLIFLFILAGIIHLALNVLKGLDASPFAFEGTLKVVAYSYVSSIAQVVPFIGGLISLGLLIYIAINGIQSVHRTSMQTAVIAVLAPIVLCCVCAVVVGMLFGAAIGAAMAGAAGG